MIYYPIQTLVNAGITDIMIVTGGNSAGLSKLLGNGKPSVSNISLHVSGRRRCIAEALWLVEHFAAKEPVCVVLGDNIIEGNAAARCAPIENRARSQDHFEAGSRPERWRPRTERRARFAH